MRNSNRMVYIVLTDTGTWLARMIRLYTKKELNHASVALDSELREVFSFGRKQPRNPFIGGFVKENFRDPFFADANCAVYSCEVSEMEYRKLCVLLKNYEQTAHHYKYNFIGLFGVMLNIGMKREHYYFCSQFISSVFREAGIVLVDKAPEFTTPYDLECAQRLRLVYRGKLGDSRLDQIGLEQSEWSPKPTNIVGWIMGQIG